MIIGIGIANKLWVSKQALHFWSFYFIHLFLGKKRAKMPQLDSLSGGVLGKAAEIESKIKDSDSW